MKNSILLPSLLALFTLLSFSCEKISNKCDSPVVFQAIDFSNYSEIQISNQKVEDKFFVINSQEDFDRNTSFAHNNEQMNINFDTYTLLIGKKALGGVPGKLIKQDVSLSCDSTELTYNVEIQNGGYTAIGNFIFGVLIPKSNATVKLNVDVKKQP